MHRIQHLYLAPQAAFHARLLAVSSTTPTTTGGSNLPTGKSLPPLPGLHTAMGLIQDVVTLVWVLAFAGIVVSAARMAIGHHTGNPGEVMKAKHGLLASLLAAVIVGGAHVLINFASAAGSGI